MVVTAAIAALRPRRGDAARARATASVAEDLGAGARAPRRGRARRRRPAARCCARACACCRSGPLHADHPLRRAAGLGLGSSGALDVALVARPGRGRGATGLDVARSPISPAGSKAVEAGIPGGRQDQFAAAYRRVPPARASATPTRRSSRSRSTRRSPRSSSGGCCSATPARRASPAARSAG